MPIDELLQPISPSSPGGEDPSGEQQFIKLTQAIRPPSYGRDPDYAVAEDLATSLLSSKSKDLQVAAFYTEALVHRRGFSGLTDGLTLLHGLLDCYWDHLYPLDHGHRRGPLATIASDDFAVRVQLQSLNNANHAYYQYRQASSMPTAEDANQDDKARTTRQRMLDDGRVSPEAFQEAVDDTPKQFYKDLSADITASLAAIQQLDATCKERFGQDDAPSFRGLRLATEAVSTLVTELLAKKLEKDPDVVASSDAPADGSPAAGTDRTQVPGLRLPDEKPREQTDAWTALTQATTERERFLARLEIAALMVDAGRLSVAKPLLQHLIEEIDERRLADWEDPAIIARPFALMIRCLDAKQEDSDRREEYYVRVCRLSPRQALGLAT